MADFDLEQLKTIFENLGERLNQTQGDNLTRAEMARVRGVLERMSRKIDGISRTTSTTARNQERSRQGATPSSDNPKTLIKEFLDDMKKENIIEEMRNRQRTQSGTILLDEEAKSRRTIISELQDYQEETGETSEFIKDLGQETKKTQTGLERFGEALKKSGIATAAAGITKTALNAADISLDAYRSIMASGEGSIGTLQQLNRAAGAAGRTVEQFSQNMEKGTEGARLLGAVRFANMNKAVQEMTRASGAMGMTVDMIDKAGQEYAEILRLQGMSTDRTNEQMAEGMIRMVRSSEITASILGKTREEAIALAREQATNQNVTAAMLSQGMGDNQIAARQFAGAALKEQFGEGALTALNDLMTFGTIINTSAAEFVSRSPEAFDMIRALATDIRNDVKAEDVQQRNAMRMEAMGASLVNDRSRLGMTAMLASIEGGSGSKEFTELIRGAMLSQNIGNLAEKLENAGSKLDQRAQTDEEAAGTVGFVQMNEVDQLRKVVQEQAVLAVFNATVTTFGDTLANDINPRLIEFSETLVESMNTISKENAGLVGSLGGGLVALTAAVGGIVAAAGALSAIKNGLSIFSMLRGGSAAGALASGGAGAAAGGVRGGTILGSLMGGGAPAGGAASAAGAATRGAGLFGRALPIVGAGLLGYEALSFGADQIGNRRGESLTGTGQGEGGFFGSRLSGYLTSMAGGAATGGLIGAGFAGIGAIPGAIAGGAIGLGSALYNDFTQPTMPNRDQNMRASRSDQPISRSDASGQNIGANLNIDQMTNRMMMASEKAAELLKQMKENSDAQLGLAREEISLIRDHNGRVLRLLEQGNRNTKMIAETAI